MLLYILISRPSVIPVVVEELASVEFSSERFEQLRQYMIDNPDLSDFVSFNGTVDGIRQMAGGFCPLVGMSDGDVVRLWKGVKPKGVE